MAFCWMAIPRPTLDAASHASLVVKRMVDLRLTSAVHERDWQV